MSSNNDMGINHITKKKKKKKKGKKGKNKDPLCPWWQLQREARASRIFGVIKDL